MHTCMQRGRGARAGAARQTDRQQRASSREIGTSLGLGGTWGRRLSSREREPVVRSPPPNKNSGEIVCSVRRMLRPKWRLHPRVQWARTQSVPGATSAMWCVKWRRDDDPLRRPCTSDIDCSRHRNPMHPSRWPSTSQHPLPPVWPQDSRFPDRSCTAYLKVGLCWNKNTKLLFLLLLLWFEATLSLRPFFTLYCLPILTYYKYKTTGSAFHLFLTLHTY